MTLLLPALVLAILLGSVLTSAVGRRGVAYTFSVVRRFSAGHPESEPTTTASAGLRIQHRGHDRSARRSMDRYIQTVVADLGTLSLKPASATYAIRAGRRVAGASPLRDVGILSATTPYSSTRVPSRSVYRYSA